MTSSVLLNYFQEIDIVEQDDKFVEHSKITFKNEPKVKNIYQSSLQNFKFEKEYNLIWIQWCVENLDDDDLLYFMIKCKKSLASDGMVIVTPPSTPGSRAAQLAARSSSAAHISGSIAV